MTSSYVNLDREPLFYKNTKQVILMRPFFDQLTKSM